MVVKLAGKTAEAFLLKPDPAVRAVLLYGPDAGLIRERAAALLAQIVADPQDPFSVSEISAAQLKDDPRSEEHTSELQSLMRISYAVFCLKKKNIKKHQHVNK